MSRLLKGKVLGIGLVMPSFLTLLVLVAYPVMMSVRTSLQNRAGEWSWDNYRYIFTEPLISQNIRHTMFVTIISCFFVLIIAYGIALYLRFSTRFFSKLINKLYLIPMFIPGVIAVYGFINFYRNNGWVARLIGTDNMLPIIYHVRGLIMINVWFNIPFTTMLLLSALQGIPNSIIEGARDVGATKWQLFIRFILPLSYKTMLVAITFLFMGIIGSFTAPFLIDRNAPQMLGVSMQQHFSVFNEIGQSSSLAVFMFLLSSAVGCFYIWSNMKHSKKELS
ncbi:ABC-type spermidine/putrescine transport system, permease component I [Amphibacillus marinus]|uniref:ABC-type spermidine/putrescine transport system, permease component I n=1 Tax=Amphibacillus marinus TaxID=872970 RepID=A0A1H8JUK3_9BACI|nr:ABC transporter permease subunit [Amphibacillus marinus]SEN84281.1 ABC-type spermidine/putrescine transport system, permease component I [Amphibacillus marinus]